MIVKALQEFMGANKTLAMAHSKQTDTFEKEVADKQTKKVEGLAKVYIDFLKTATKALAYVERAVREFAAWSGSVALLDRTDEKVRVPRKTISKVVNVAKGAVNVAKNFIKQTFQGKRVTEAAADAVDEGEANLDRNTKTTHVQANKDAIKELNKMLSSK